MFRVEVILTETEQADAVGAEPREVCEKAAREALRQEASRLAEVAGLAHAAQAGGEAEADVRVEVSVTLTDDPGIRELNRRYLDRDRPTDVLAFPMGDGSEGPAGDFAGKGLAGEPFLLGDVVVSVDTARSQAADYGRPPLEELGRLVVHGVLHLLGYTDEDDQSAARMHAREDSVLEALGFEPGTT